MSTLAQTIVSDAHTALQDPKGVRWPASELVHYLNRAQRDIQVVRPDATAASESLALATGFRQSLPAQAAALLDVPANVTGERITKVDAAVLDAFEPSWRKRDGALIAKHFMHDPRMPRQFLVYPPAAAGAAVELAYSAYPVDVPDTSSALARDVTGQIGLADQFGTALLALVLHYAYAKDAQFGGNANLAATYLARAESVLGVQLQASAAVAKVS